VHMVRVTGAGFTYTAARDAPSLPASVGGPVQAIGGLQPFRQAHKHSRIRMPRGGNRGEAPAAGQGAPQPGTNFLGAPPYLPREVLDAYNGDGLGDGGGQVIAI